jgi:endonuclease-8
VPEGDSLHRIAGVVGPVLVGRVIERVTFPRKTTDTAGLTGARVIGVEARGKNLLVHFELTDARRLSLHVHLAMRGRVNIVRRGAPIGGEVVAIVETEHDAVVVRSAPVARLVRTEDLARDRAFRDLGPDLLAPTFDVAEGVGRLRARNDRPLGVALLDQGAIAGIGNVWKSELCFLLHLDPFAPVSHCTDEELGALLALAREKLRENVDRPKRRLPDPFMPRAGRIARAPRRMNEGPLSVYDRAGQPCYECETTIASAPQGTPAQGSTTPRITYWCPSCQPARP